MADDWVSVNSPSGGGHDDWTPVQSTPKPEAQDIGLSSPLTRPMMEAAKTIVPPVVNFLDYPARAIAADLYAVTPGTGGAFPIDEASRRKFYETRQKSLEATALPETKTGEAISQVLSVPGALVGKSIKAASEATIGKEGTAAIGPIATIAGDALPAAMAARAALSSPSMPNLRPAALEARNAGYVLPPTSITEKPGLVANVLAGWGGKIKTQQEAASRNQEITNDLAKSALGLPKDAVLNERTFSDLRDRAGRAYAAVSQAVPDITADAAYNQTVANLSGKNAQAQAMFPGIVKNQAIIDLQDELRVVQRMPTSVAVELVRELRFNANNNFKALGDPSKVALGMAQRHAADAIDELMDRNITAAGSPDVVKKYKQARELIAKSYDVEGATNPATGDVSARHLAGLSVKGRPLSGNLDTIANTALAFPKAMQSPAGFGYEQPWSALDAFATGAAMLTGNPEAALTFLGRPLARNAVLSQPFQNRLVNPPASSPAVRAFGVGSLLQPHDDVLETMGLQ